MRILETKKRCAECMTKSKTVKEIMNQRFSECTWCGHQQGEGMTITVREVGPEQEVLMIAAPA